MPPGKYSVETVSIGLRRYRVSAFLLPGAGKRGYIENGMGVFGHRVRAGSVLIHMHEIFGRFY